MERFNNLDELSHHGILGMKWGVRRYQNKDGTLTPAGKKRADKMKDEYTKLTGKRLVRKPTSKSSKTTTQETDKKKSIKELSDTELREKVNRLQLEKQATQLEVDTGSKGKKFINKVGSDVVTPAAVEAGKRLLTNLFISVGNKALGLNNDGTEAATDVYKELRSEVEGLELEARKAKAQKTINSAKQENNSKKKNNDSNSNNTKTEEVTGEFVNKKSTSKSNKSSKSSNKIVLDAEWTEVKSDSTALVPYVNTGENYVKRLLER